MRCLFLLFYLWSVCLFMPPLFSLFFSYFRFPSLFLIFLIFPVSFLFLYFVSDFCLFVCFVWGAVAERQGLGDGVSGFFLFFWSGIVFWLHYRISLSGGFPLVCVKLWFGNYSFFIKNKCLRIMGLLMFF